MLVLTRKSTESIQVGDHIVVKILEIRGSKVRIGIDAPEGVHVVRTELLNAGFKSIGAKGPTTINPPLVPRLYVG